MLDAAARGGPGSGASRSRARLRTQVDGPAATRPGDPAVLAWVAALALLALLPVWLRPGFVLSYDMVAVPQQQLLPWMWGGGEAPPRAVPQDVLVAALDNLLPGALLQRLLLTLVLLGAGAGMARLTAPHGRVGQLVAVSAYVWSAYVYERLVIGHWGLLLAYAALPWLVAALAAARRGDGRGAPAAVLVTAVGTWVPTGGALLVAVALPMLLWPGGALSSRGRWLTCAGVLAVQLTWVVPGVLTAGEALATGVFGLGPDGLVEALVGALGGAGIWHPRAAAASREGVLGLVTAAVVIAVLAAGLPGVRRGLGGRTLTPLLVVSLLLAGWALASAMPALDGPVGAVQRVPGGGLLRDAQKWLAPWWLVCSLAFAATAARLRRALGPGDARLLPFALALVPLVLLPELLWAGLGHLTPARYPPGWEETRAALADAPDTDLVVSLPWSTFRRYSWNHDRTVLDPAPRYLPRTVVTDTTLLVTDPAGEAVPVPGDDPLSSRVEQALRATDPLQALRRVGVGWVLVERGQPAAPGAPATPDLSGAVEVVRSDDLLLYRIPGPVAPSSGGTAAPVLAAWTVLAAVAVIALVGLRRATRRGNGHSGAST